MIAQAKIDFNMPFRLGPHLYVLWALPWGLYGPFPRSLCGRFPWAVRQAIARPGFAGPSAANRVEIDISLPNYWVSLWGGDQLHRNPSDYAG